MGPVSSRGILPLDERKSDHAHSERVGHRRELCLVCEMGWRKCWDCGTPPTFGAVGSGECGAQGGRGKGTNTTTFQQDGDEQSDKNAWLSVWADDVDELCTQCLAASLDVTFPPTDMPWKVREMHLRHPDGHVFRVGKGIEERK